MTWRNAFFATYLAICGIVAGLLAGFIGVVWSVVAVVVAILIGLGLYLRSGRIETTGSAVAEVRHGGGPTAGSADYVREIEADEVTTRGLSNMIDVGSADTIRLRKSRFEK